ncbi:hypothetical protein G7Y79_00018g044500 [Physcia stellaris]|nr:hypothetical protein G7Y79_00018g044500 [Physcia stellaris]
MPLILALRYQNLRCNFFRLGGFLRLLSCSYLLPTLRSVLASPIPETTLQNRYTVDCTDLAADFDYTCWATLGLSDYLISPETGWMYTTPNCTEDSSGANCCKPDEPWSTCYLHLAHGVAGDDCSEINPQSCTYDATLDVDPKIAAQVRYVMRNIYSTLPQTCQMDITDLSKDVNNFFTTWWEALQFATAQASTIVGSVIGELDPVQKSHFTLYNILIGLTVGLCFVAMPEVAGAVGASLIASQVGAHLVIALQEAPMVARAIWPKGTEDSQLVQIGDVKDELGNVNRNLSSLLNAGLETVMKDLPTFVSFVQDGHFSGDQYISLPKTTAGLDMALKTFIVSTAMTKNDWRATPMLYMTRGDFASAKGCAFGPENYDICTQEGGPASYFYSNTTGNGYLLSNGGEAQNVKSPRDLMFDIVNNQWSSLGALFDGAFNCTSSGNAASDQPFHIKFDGTIDLSCVSQLQMCGYCEACIVPLINGTCPMPGCYCD